jgi:hypothetical protein
VPIKVAYELLQTYDKERIKAWDEAIIIFHLYLSFALP